MNYFKSKNVKILPCTYRGEDTAGSIYDPEARLLSEYNLTHLPARLPNKTSYVISYSEDLRKLVCCIEGYLIEIAELIKTNNLKLGLFYLANETNLPRQVLCTSTGITTALDVDGQCLCLAYTTTNGQLSAENSDVTCSTLAVWEAAQEASGTWLHPFIENIKSSGLISAYSSNDGRTVTLSTTATRNPNLFTQVNAFHEGVAAGTLNASGATDRLGINTSGDLVKAEVTGGQIALISPTIGDNLALTDKNQLTAKVPEYKLEKDEDTLTIKLLRDGVVISTVSDAAGISEDGATAFSTATVNNKIVANANDTKNLDLKYKLTQATNGNLQLKWDNNDPVSSIDLIKGKLSLRQDSDTGALELCWPNSSTPISSIEDPIGSNLSLVQDTTTGAIKLCWPNSSVPIGATVTLQPFKMAGTTCTGIYPWAQYLSTSITIPSTVKAISAGAFKDCTWLTEVTIPGSVESIGKGAFQGCTGLAKLTAPFVGGSADANRFLGYIFGTSTHQANKSYVPAGMRTVVITSGSSIGNYAFYGCNNLTSITIPDSVLELGENAFRNCTGLTSITIPDSVTSVGSSAFWGCTGLTSITIPDGVTSIGDSILSSCNNLTSLRLPFICDPTYEITYFGYLFGAKAASDNGAVVPAALTTVEVTREWHSKEDFSGCSHIMRIMIPESATAIGDQTFENCKALTAISIPNGVQYIGTCAFSGCSSLSNLSIPASVVWVGPEAFANSGLQSITFEKSLLQGTGNYEIDGAPFSYTSGAPGIFHGCTQLTHVVWGVQESKDLPSYIIPEACARLRDLFFPVIANSSANARVVENAEITWHNPQQYIIVGSQLLYYPTASYVLGPKTYTINHSTSSPSVLDYISLPS